jgi:hypothetical protein
MNSKALAKVLESYAKNSPLSSSRDWTALARVFAAGKTKPVADFIAELGGLAIDVPKGSLGLGALLPEIQTMQAIATALGKPPFAEALDHLKRAAELRPSITAEAIERALQARAPDRVRGGARQKASRDPSLVPGYNSRLEEALGDESGFDSVMSQLEVDKRLTATDFKQLAKSFTGRAVKNKVDALEAIKARQRNLMDARAKQRFNAGQTAA